MASDPNTALGNAPSTPLHKLFPNASYPTGKELKYDQDIGYHGDSSFNEQELIEYRQAAGAIRQVGQWTKGAIKPGQTLLEIASTIESSIDHLLGRTDDMRRNHVATPTNLSLNHIATCYTPNDADTTTIQQNDVLKVQLSAMVNGRIAENAYTIAFDPIYDNLVAASKEAAKMGIKGAGLDVRVGELGGLMQEVIQSYEHEADGKTVPIKPIGNLNGRNVLQYQVHGGKTVPCVRNDDPTKMQEGDVFIISAFASTGFGFVRDGSPGSIYKLNAAVKKRLADPKTVRVFQKIKEHFGPLPFCSRQLNKFFEWDTEPQLKILAIQGMIDTYPPQVDKVGSYTAQHSTTVLLQSTGKELFDIE